CVCVCVLCVLGVPLLQGVFSRAVQVSQSLSSDVVFFLCPHSTSNVCAVTLHVSMITFGCIVGACVGKVTPLPSPHPSSGRPRNEQAPNLHFSLCKMRESC